MGLTVALQLGLTYLPWMQAVFSTAPLSIVEWVPILGVGVAVLAFGEAAKRVSGWRFHGHRLPWIHAVT